MIAFRYLANILFLLLTFGLLATAAPAQSKTGDFQGLTEYFQTEGFKQLVKDVDALPEIKILMDYIHNAGIDIYKIVNIINNALGLPPLTPPGRKMARFPLSFVDEFWDRFDSDMAQGLKLASSHQDVHFDTQTETAIASHMADIVKKLTLICTQITNIFGPKVVEGRIASMDNSLSSFASALFKPIPDLPGLIPQS